MLKEVFLGALRDKEVKISKVKDSNFHKILADASSRWISYESMPEICKSVGIDSSWNRRAFQGLQLYVIDAVAVTSTSRILSIEWEQDIVGSARSELLESRAMVMEAPVAQKAVGEADIICVDGSLVSRLTKSRPEAASEMVKKCSNCIFISKTSESRLQFSQMGSMAGDIYYYGHTCKDAGFSIPVETQFCHAPLFEVYARLRDHTPVIRLEIMSSASETEVKSILNKLRYHSVAGYPYCLKLAHNTCKISNEDIDRLASIFGLQNEQGARDALNE
ncbi:MAG: DNA double-strand break repair nuclease NurA [Nitrososphaeraceae archaeon]|nr:DNA double-strand break repair nuclease NurA [Nitrososphaeraceae archaeon]